MFSSLPFALWRQMVEVGGCLLRGRFKHGSKPRRRQVRRHQRPYRRREVVVAGHRGRRARVVRGKDNRPVPGRRLGVETGKKGVSFDKTSSLLGISEQYLQLLNHVHHLYSTFQFIDPIIYLAKISSHSDSLKPSLDAIRVERCFLYLWEPSPLHFIFSFWRWSSAVRGMWAAWKCLTDRTAPTTHKASQTLKFGWDIATSLKIRTIQGMSSAIHSRELSTR